MGRQCSAAEDGDSRRLWGEAASLLEEAISLAESQGGWAGPVCFVMRLPFECGVGCRNALPQPQLQRADR